MLGPGYLDWVTDGGCVYRPCLCREPSDFMEFQDVPDDFQCLLQALPAEKTDG